MAKRAKKTYEDEYLEILGKLEGDAQGKANAKAYLESRGLADADWALTPVVLDAAKIELLQDVAHNMSSIMEKVMTKYHRDSSFRALFGLSHEVEALTLVPSGSRAAVPLARVDLFLDQKTNDYQICGIATGGVDGMTESVDVVRAIEQTGAYREFVAQHETVESMDAADALVDALLNTYGNWANAQEGRNHPTNPAVAVVDFADSPRRLETDYIIERMRDHGCYAHATDPSELRIEKVGGLEQLVDSRGPVTCVWLRPTAEEAVSRPGDGISTLLRATRHGDVCTIGGYRSWPCCTRGFLEILRARECETVLSFRERAFIREHVVETHVIGPATDISTFYDQDDWVLKMADGHALATVLAGRDMSRSNWRGMLVKAIKRHDAAQRYIPQATMQVVSGNTEDFEPVEKNVMLGLYVFGGELAGVRAICGVGNTTASWNDRMAMGVLLAK